MKKMNFEKYKPCEQIILDNRKWASNVMTKAPIWSSVDLRDGNQALSLPMDIERKIKFFELLVSIGFKEIEVGFPSASEIEFLFVRKLIEEKRIPDDVTIQVLTQARSHLIEKTFKALKGVKKAIVHLYNSTSKIQREVVFKKNKSEIIAIAVNGAKIVKDLAKKYGEENFILEYSPESFTGTELDFALDISHSVMNEWSPSKNNKIIINLPSTVEVSTPNVYADRIEYFINKVNNRDSVIISVHTHNDRGCAVASSELALLAGAERVEGSLFGNGERSGNMDIIILALNLFSNGINPMLDFSDIPKIKEIYEECTGMTVHNRHPYSGDLVYTAFSGSHQDAIKKGMDERKQEKKEIWEVPYLPIDPKDIGCSYEAIIRINSQSGKGGVSYVLKEDFGIVIPKWMQADIGESVQNETELKNRELTKQEIFTIFERIYVDINSPIKLIKCDIYSKDNKLDSFSETKVYAVVNMDNKDIEINEIGNGPLDAFCIALNKILGEIFTFENYFEHSLSKGSDSYALSFVELKNKTGKSFFGAGKSNSLSVASIRAFLSALNIMMN